MYSDQERLNDILEAAHIIDEVARHGQAAFMESHILQSAVLYNFLVIGETVGHLSDHLKQSHPEVKWRDIKSFRNLLIHGYMHTNLGIIWGIIQSDLPELQEQVRAILAEFSN